MDENSKEKFLKVYSNLPLNLREEIILVLDVSSDKKLPITWNVAYLEVKNDTDLGEKILEKLEGLNFI
jgi:hypothetical protein